MVLYQAVMSQQKTVKGEDGETQTYEGELYLCYVGLLFGTGTNFPVYGETNNRTAMAVTTERVSDISSLRLIDRKGNTYWQSPSDLNMYFDTEFFDVFNTIDEYNALVAKYATDSSQRETLSKQMGDMVDGYKQACLQNPNYHINYNGETTYTEIDNKVMRIADKKALPIVIVYFVAIYVIGDFLLGNLYIVRFFKWFLFKVCKIPHKEKKSPKKEEVFGHDYYSMVTLSLDVTEVPDFSGSVEIKYTNSDAEAVFTLIKAENYTATQRLKAGTYVNPFITINRQYGPVDLPDNLVVEGYRMELTVKIVKRPDTDTAIEENK